MKGVILAGGTGTRLYPLTRLINKHLLPVGNYPMVCYGIERLRQAGITDILMVISKQSAGLYADFFGSGENFGVNLNFRVQENAGGIAEALQLAEGFITSGEKFVVLLGDNLFLDDLTPFVNKFNSQADSSARVLLKWVADPRRYGVAVFDPDDEEKIAYIEEKPKEPKSKYSVTGIYMYDDAVFEIIQGIHPSKRGELEITDVNNRYAQDGKLEYDVLQLWWGDAGTFESLKEAETQMRGVLP